MGKIRQGILGGVSGKVGVVVGGDWKGIPYLRTFVIPANPNTALQQGVRSKMSLITSIGRTILNTIIQKFWDKYAVKMSGFNAFVKRSMLDMTSAVDYLNLSFARGGLEGVVISTKNYNDTTGVVTITFLTTTLSNGLPTDRIVAVVLDSANKVTFVADSGTTRTAGTISLNIGGGRNVATLVFSLFAYTFPGSVVTLVSNSMSEYEV